MEYLNSEWKLQHPYNQNQANFGYTSIDSTENSKIMKNINVALQIQNKTTDTAASFDTRQQSLDESSPQQQASLSQASKLQGCNHQVF